jgi:hypothetical protein
VSSHRLTPELADSIIRDVERGLFLTQIGLHNGVHPNTIRNWVRRGLAVDADEPFRSFAERFAKAEVKVEAGLVAIVAEASRNFESVRRQKKHRTRGGLMLGLVDPSEIEPAEETETLEERIERRGDWRAAAFLLERRFPKRWGEAAADSSQRDSLDLVQILDEAESRGQDLDDLVSNPPPELEAAILRNKDRLLALLGVPQLPTAAK